ncbi:hypothetical protein [Candidatus Clostridium stratigraminis]|uniref:Lipoprotein n=1 Tax=Candidatus Clostridium stratigraminis TaxID=3381661 RepID=A0ABW8T710_9CLOT
MNKLIKILVVNLILAIVFMAGCSRGILAKLPNTIKTLEFDNIKSARIELARTGSSPIKKYSFDFNSPSQIKILKDVISQLNSAKFQGNADEKVVNKGGSPTFLVLELKDGSIIQIKSAVEGKVTKLSDGSTEISQFDIPNEVTISINSNIESFRVLSPEIKELIDSGYKDIFK